MGELIIAREEDFFHDILVKDKLKEWGSEGTTVVQYPLKHQDMSFYTYRTFTGEDTAILHVKNPRLLSNLKTFDFDYWNIVVYTEQHWTPDDSLQDLLGERLIQLPIIRQYTDKQDFFKDRLKGHKFEKGMQRILISNLTRDPSQYGTVKTYLDTKEGIIKLEDLQYILGDVDLYNFEEFLINTLYGESKRKTVWMLDYFLNTRGYSGHWIYGKIRDMALQVGYLYTMHRKGVFNRAMTFTDYKTRVEAMGVTVKEGWLRFKTQEVILDKYKTEGQKILNKRIVTVLTNKIQNDNDLYGLVVKLRDVV